MAADVGKTAAGMVRKVKSNGIQINASLPMCYVAAAASGALAHSMHNTTTAKTSSVQVQREVFMSTGDMLTIQSLREINQWSLNAHVEKMIEQSSGESIAKAKVMSANR